MPVLLLVVAVLAVMTANRNPQEQPPADPVLALPEPLGTLWSAWGEDLGSEGGSYPVQLAALDRGEALYVLLTVSAAQVAEAVAAATARSWTRPYRPRAWRGNPTTCRSNGSEESPAAS